MLALSGGYTGAGNGRAFGGYNPLRGDVNAAILPDLPMLRERSSELARNNPIAGGAIHTVVSRTVGTGLAPQFTPNRFVLGWTEEQAADWKKIVAAEFSLWADSKNCDITRRNNFYSLQDLVCRGALERGDALSLLPMQAVSDSPYQLRVQVLEADRCGNPKGSRDSAKEAGGVRVDDFGAPESYYIYKNHPGAYLTADRASSLEGEWVEAYTKSGQPRVLHHFRQFRPDQRRGVPYLAPVIESLKQLGRYTEAEIMAAVVSGMFTVFITQEPGEEGVVPSNTGNADQVELDNGAVIDLAAGEKIETANPGRPNTAFDPFVMAILRQVGMALELPFEVLVKHFTSSYSAARAALLDTYIFIKGRRAWLAAGFCQPVFEAWLAEAVALGRVDAPGFFQDPLIRAAYCKVIWNGDSPGAIDPVKEVTAWRDAIDGNLATHEMAEMALFGTDFDQTIDQKAREHNLLDAAGLIAKPAPAAIPPAQNDSPDAQDVLDKNESDSNKKVSR